MFDVFDDDMYWVFNDIKYVIQANNEFGLDKEIPLRIHKNEVDLCIFIPSSKDSCQNCDYF